MKIEWLLTNVTSVTSLAGAEGDFFDVILNVFWPIQAALVVEEPLCDLGIDSWLVTNVTAVGSSARVERDNFGIFVDSFGQFRPLLCSGSHVVI